MCGRFAFNGEHWPESLPIDMPEVEPNYNISPQDEVPCLVMEDDALNITHMRWGFRPSWSKKSSMEPINARIESVSLKPMFRDSFENKRCLIPINGWYEWKTTPRGKIPFYHYSKDEPTLFLAGIYDDWADDSFTKRSFCILTTSSHEAISHIHGRMPVIIPETSINQWLKYATFESSQSQIELHPVDRKVNATTAQGIGLTLPIRTLFD